MKPILWDPSIQTNLITTTYITQRLTLETVLLGDPIGSNTKEAIMDNCRPHYHMRTFGDALVLTSFTTKKSEATKDKEPNWRLP